LPANFGKKRRIRVVRASSNGPAQRFVAAGVFLRSRGETGLSKTDSSKSDLSKSEQYRRFARECLEMADVATDRRAQTLLIHMAQVWLRLAQEHEAVHEAPAAQSSDG
jgi:hypothetical protein